LLRAVTAVILPGITEAPVSSSSQKKAVADYRARLGARGMARFEVVGLSADRELIRSLARRLADDDAEAKRLRTTVSRSVQGEAPRKGGILEALRRSPLVGAEIDLRRPATGGRKIDL
jgi:hypothetical protein